MQDTESLIFQSREWTIGSPSGHIKGNKLIDCIEHRQYSARPSNQDLIYGLYIQVQPDDCTSDVHGHDRARFCPLAMPVARKLSTGKLSSV